jgi:hypothetical protein
MYKNYINLENFNKLEIIFLEDDKLESSMNFLFLTCSSVALETWLLHHVGSILCDHMVSPKGFLKGTQGYVTCNIQVKNSNVL